MRKYSVVITPVAEADALAAFEYINARSALNAARWLDGLYRAIEKLESFAGHGRAPESELLDPELRQIIF